MTQCLTLFWSSCSHWERGTLDRISSRVFNGALYPYTDSEHLVSARAASEVLMTLPPGGWRASGGGSSSNYCSGSSCSDYFAGWSVNSQASSCVGCLASCLANCSASCSTCPAGTWQVRCFTRCTRVPVKHSAHISLCTSMVTRMGRVTAVTEARHLAKDSQDGPLLMSSANTCP